MLSSDIDEVVVEAGPILPAQMPASDRRRCSLVQTNGAFLGSLERANKDTCASCQRSREGRQQP